MSYFLMINVSLEIVGLRKTQRAHQILSLLKPLLVYSDIVYCTFSGAGLKINYGT